MQRNLVETLIGAVVLGVALLFLVFAYQRADIQSVEGYEIIASFDRVDGLRPGSDVRLSGIKIGTVQSQRLDPKTYFAEVRMSIDSQYQLPTDTSASISSDGLLGDKYISLVPGGDEAMLKPGGRVQITQGAIDLMSLVGQYIFSQQGSSKPKGSEDKSGGTGDGDKQP